VEELCRSPAPREPSADLFRGVAAERAALPVLS
jgi:hypothetical protein